MSAIEIHHKVCVCWVFWHKHTLHSVWLDEIRLSSALMKSCFVIVRVRGESGVVCGSMFVVCCLIYPLSFFFRSWGIWEKHHSKADEVSTSAHDALYQTPTSCELIEDRRRSLLVSAAAVMSEVNSERRAVITNRAHLCGVGASFCSAHEEEEALFF